ncbi:MinD/ParA family protein [Microbacterium sp. NPDC090007]|uniref:MinD/ParA family ATP-binding protein n=1 Tax=Microbacterium sp. NPDC090007 TaxID=3364204 RepID=UPI00380493BB
MTPDRTDENPHEGAEHGVLDESGNLDTASITILGGRIAQVSVDLPVASDDDDIDDDVIEDELPIDSAPADLAPGGAQPAAIAADRGDAAPGEEDLVQDHHVEQLPTGDIILEPHDGDIDHRETEPLDDVLDAEVVDEEPPTDAEAPGASTDGGSRALAADESAGIDAAAGGSHEDAGDEDAGHENAGHESARREDAGHEDAGHEDAGHEGARHENAGHEGARHENAGHEDGGHEGARNGDAGHEDAGDVPGAVDDGGGLHDDDRAADLQDLEVVEDVELFEADAAEPVDLDDAAGDPDRVDAAVVAAALDEPLTHAPWTPAPAEEVVDETAARTIHDAPADHVVAKVPDEAAVAGASSGGSSLAGDREDDSAADLATADAASPAAAVSATPTTRAERAATGVIGTVPLTRRGAHQADEAARAADDTARVERAHAMERVRTTAPEVALTSKRIGQIDDQRESSDLLTADRLLDPRQITRPEPEGLWQQLVYSVSRHRINLGDGRRARDRKDLDRRIAAPLTGGARFVPVLSRKGGVGKTTVTSLLGMALADARDDRIIAVDANPDRGTLADRVGRPNGRTVRDLVRAHDEMAGYNDVSTIVARDATRLDVLASDYDPRVSEAFSDDDYRQVADVAAHYYSIVLTDTGTGIVHSVMGATLELADTLVIVAGLSVDEARLASETLTWLETNGYGARVRDAVVVLNNARPGAPLVRENELEAHFRSRVRTVIRMPYDARIAAGSAIAFRDLEPSTRQAARELAAAVVEGLRASAGAA